MNGIPFVDGQVTLTQYRIDADHSNAYEAWLRLGSPFPLSAGQYVELEKAVQLAELGQPEPVEVKADRAEVKFNLPRQGVALLVLKWNDEADLKAQLATRHLSPATCFVIAHTKIPAGFAAANVSVIPHDAEAFARALYAELHRCDAAGAQVIVVEAPPDLPEWSGIADRLRRAAA